VVCYIKLKIKIQMWCLIQQALKIDNVKLTEVLWGHTVVGNLSY